MSKLRALLNKGLSKSKSVLKFRPVKFLNNLTLSFTRVALIIFIATAGYFIHHDYLRAIVGSKTVKILSPDGRGGGSGFFVKAASGKTYIMTNAHVCALNKKNQLLVRTKNNDGPTVRNIVKVYDKHDLCLIENVGDFAGIGVADSLIHGRIIHILGHPKLQPLTASKGEYIGPRMIQLIVGANMTSEACSQRGGRLMNAHTVRETNIYLNSTEDAQRKVIEDLKRIINQFFPKSYCVKNYNTHQITAYSRGGSSGSPVVNYYGNVIGVLFAGNTRDQFESFMVPLDAIKDFLKDY